jgi:hypothetical protein
MTSRQRLYNEFIDYLNLHIQRNGPQNILEIKQLAKDFCIQSRGGVYDLTCRKRYFYVFRFYCVLKNNAQFPEGWDTLENTQYDPDNEYVNDPKIIKLKRKDEIRQNNLLRDTLRLIEERDGPIDE